MRQGLNLELEQYKLVCQTAEVSSDADGLVLGLYAHEERVAPGLKLALQGAGALLDTIRDNTTTVMKALASSLVVGAIVNVPLSTEMAQKLGSRALKPTARIIHVGPSFIFVIGADGTAGVVMVENFIVPAAGYAAPFSFKEEASVQVAQPPAVSP
jgi:hypothetical protein